MEQIIYAIIGLVTRIHNSILTWNDSIETSFTDKELHFLVIGIFGLLLIFAFHPLFLWLTKTGHTMIVSFLYVFTVVIVVAFAIEIGQGVTGTGAMEKGDITYGILGFLFFFVIFAIIRAIVHLIMRLWDNHKRKSRSSYYG